MVEVRGTGSDRGERERECGERHSDILLEIWTRMGGLSVWWWTGVPLLDMGLST